MILRTQLKKLGACEAAIDWVGRKGIKTAWNTCKDGYWMTWLLARLRIQKVLWKKLREANKDLPYSLLLRANQVREVIPYTIVKKALHKAFPPSR